MSTLKVCSITLLLALTSACSTGYHGSGTLGGIPFGGYSDTRYTANTAEVSFDGNIFTSQATAQNYLLYRCAEVTRNNGYDYFIITSTSTSPMNVNVATRTSYNGYVTEPPKLYTAYNKTESYRSSYISGTGCTYPGDYCKEQHKVVAIIKMFRGNVPPDAARAYNANDVIAHNGAGT